MHRSSPKSKPDSQGKSLGSGRFGQWGTRHILSALRNGQLSILYQPIVDLRSEDAVGLEAFLSWEQPDHGHPDSGFFGLESCKSSLREALERWMIFRACQEFSAFSQNGCLGPTIKLHVNVSSKLFLDHSLPGYLQRVLDESGMAPDRFCLNWGRNADERPSSRYLRFYRSLSSTGIDLAVNNLHMDLSHLNMFFKLNFIPFALVKIDQEEAARLGEDFRASESLLTFIRIFSSLGIRLVVNGVRTMQQVQLLRHLCCHYAQGVYLCEPAPLGALQRQRMLGA